MTLAMSGTHVLLCVPLSICVIGGVVRSHLLNCRYNTYSYRFDSERTAEGGVAMISPSLRDTDPLPTVSKRW